MRIQGISLSVPSRVVANSDILNELRRRNSHRDADEVEAYCARVSRILSLTGAKTRSIRDQANGETALSLMLSAARDALTQAGVKASALDLVVFCGVARGFLEPANAAFFCRALGAACDNFDVSEACMSWVRSLHIIDCYLRTRTYSKVLLINGEFNLSADRLQAVLTNIDLDAFQYSFPSFTLGEAATATVLTGSENEWSFAFRSNPNAAPQCALPLSDFAEYSEPDARIALNGVDQLTSFGSELMAEGMNSLVDFVEETISDREAYRIWIPHAASNALCQQAGERLKLGEKLYSKVFPRYGNLVSASVPAGIAMALADRTLERGQEMVLCPASAGASIALVRGRL